MSLKPKTVSFRQRRMSIRASTIFKDHRLTPLLALGEDTYQYLAIDILGFTDMSTATPNETASRSSLVRHWASDAGLELRFWWYSYGPGHRLTWITLPFSE